VTTYWIAPPTHATTPGNDSTGNGSNATPWATFAKAITVLVAGDTLKVKAGTYTPAAKVEFKINGTSSGNPVVVEADDPTNKPTVDGQYNIPPDDDPEAGYTSTNGTRGLFGGLITIRTSYFTWRNINVKRSQGRGFNVYGSPSSRITNIVIEDCEIQKSRTNNVAIQDANYVTVRRNHSHHSCDYLEGLTNSISPDDKWCASIKGIKMGNITFEYNHVHTGWGEGMIFGPGSENCTSRYNLIYNTASGKMYVQRGTGHRIYGNLIYDTRDNEVHKGASGSTGMSVRNEAGSEGTPIDDVWFYNNISIGNSYNFTLGGSQGGSEEAVTGVKVWHNIFVNAILPGTRPFAALSITGNTYIVDCEFVNNIIWQPDHEYCNRNSLPNNPDGTPADLDFRDNAWDSASGDVPAWLRDGNDDYSISLFAPNTALTPGTTAYNNYRPTTDYIGETIAGVTTDFLGELRATYFKGGLPSGNNVTPPPASTGLVRAGVTYNTVGQATGTVDHTDSTGMAGETPSAALVFASHATSAGSVAQFARLSVGVYATGQAVGTIRLRDAVGTAANHTSGSTSALVQLRHNSTTAVDHQQEADAFIANGLRTTRTVLPSMDAGTITALFGGTAFRAQSGTVTCSSSNGGTATISLPWTPSILFLFCTNTDFAGTNSSGGAMMSHGVATGTGAQFALSFYASTAINSEATAYLTNASIGYNAANSQTHTITTWGASTVLTTGGTTGTRIYEYLALEVTGAAVYAGTFSSRTTTGSQTLSGPNFEPAICGTFMSLVDALNTSKTDAQAGAMAVSVFTADAEESIAFSYQDNVATTNSGTVYDAKAINIMQHDQSAGITATLTSMGGTGPVLDYTAVLGSARYGILWAIEAQNVTSIVKLVPEVLRLIDNTSRRMAMWRLKTETLNLVESVRNVRGLSRVASEVLNLVESVSYLYGAVKVISEVLNLVEGVIPHRKLRQVIIEILNFHETVLPRRGFARIINETLNLVEGNIGKKLLLMIINEVLDLAESIVPARAIRRVINEGLLLDESIRRIRGLKEIISETLNLSEITDKIKNFTVIRSIIRIAGNVTRRIRLGGRL